MGIDQPEPSSKLYQRLIFDIEEGIIKVPKFQRDFVWDINSTAELLDSILKGYPIGTFILWQTDERMNEVRELGGQKFPEPKSGRVEYVLDGQQRITSLYAAYKGLIIRNKNYGEIYVNLDTGLQSGEEIVSHKKPTDGSNFISLQDILNYEDKFTEIQEDFSTELQKKIIQYKKAFDNYQFSTILLLQDNMDSAIEVFTRINTAGQTLTLFEIMCAKTYDEEKGFDMLDKWSEFTETLGDVGYGRISSSSILNTLSFILSKSKECTRGVILKLDKDDIIDKWDVAIDALKFSVDYFRTFFGIPVSQLLPYDTLLVPLAYFFHHKQNGPDSEQAKYLEEFFWQASLAHRYSSSVEQALASDIRKIDKILQGKRPNYAEFSLHLDTDVLINTEFRRSDSFCKAVFCLIYSCHPKDFQNNANVLIDNSGLKNANKKHFHHFFPRAFLKKNGYENENSLMNITIISSDTNISKIGSAAPSTYIGDFLKVNEHLSETLKTHFIELEGFGIENDDYEKFLNKRAELILQKLRNKIEL